MKVCFITDSELIHGKQRFAEFLQIHGLRSDELSIPQERMRFINSCEKCAKISFFVITASETFWREFPLNQRSSFDDAGTWWLVSASDGRKSIRVRFINSTPISVGLTKTPIYWWFFGNFISESTAALELPQNAFLVKRSLFTVCLHRRIATKNACKLSFWGQNPQQSVMHSYEVFALTLQKGGKQVRKKSAIVTVVSFGFECSDQNEYCVRHGNAGLPNIATIVA